MDSKPMVFSDAKREIAVAAVSFAAVVAAAFMGASNVTLFAPDALPEGVARDQHRILHVIYFMAWATIVLLTPALGCFWFRRRSASAARYWLTFWTVSFFAFLVHFYFAAGLLFHWDLQLILHSPQLVIAPVLDTIAMVWWGLDVALAWTLPERSAWIRVQRVLIHVLIAFLFFMGSVVEGEFLASRLTGGSMALCFVLAGLAALRAERRIR